MSWHLRRIGILHSVEVTMDEFPEFIGRLPKLDLPLPGVSGHLLQGEQHQVAFLRFDQDVDVPEHSHRAQWELVIAGEVRLNLEGRSRSYRAGQSFYIPAGARHSATVRAGFRSVVFFDQADRYQSQG